MNGNTIFSSVLACCMFLIVLWVHVSLYCCEQETETCKQELQLREKEIKELKQYVQKMDSCKVHVHYHY